MSSVGFEPDQQVQSRPRSPSSNATRTCVFGFLLIVLCFAVYYPARNHPFVNYDDNLYVTDNLHVQDGLTWDTVTWSLTTYEAGNWHPLTWMSHALDYQLYGANPTGHHETSLVLHAFNAVLVFLVLLTATRRFGCSLMVAALFAVHPLNVEPVVWVAERKTVLSMTFFLLALGAYTWYATKPKIGKYLAVAVLFALGLMAKPQVITFPFVLLLWDYWPLERFAMRHAPFARRQNRSIETSGEEPIANSEKRSSFAAPHSLVALIVEKIPLFAIAAASAVLTMLAQSSGNAVLSLGAVPLSIRLSNAIVSYIRYLGKAFWPVNLAPMYPHPGGSLHAWQVYGALFILVALTMWTVEQRRRRYLAVGWLWFLGTLIPMIGLVQVGRQAMADRYAYLPLLGIFIMVCWGIADLAAAKHLPAALLPAASVVLVLTLSLMARRQIGFWADNLALWAHTIDVTPPNYIAEDNYAGILLQRGRSEEAIVHYRRAAELHPTDPISAFNIGVYEQRHGKLREAIESYKQAVYLTTRSALRIPALNNMGHAYADLGEPEQARQCFDQARRLEGP